VTMEEGDDPATEPYGSGVARMWTP
jgi:hypothetical protein